MTRRLLLLPACLFALVFVAWPLVEVVRLSLIRTNFVSTRWVGLANFAALLRDGPFLRSLGNSVFYALLLIPLQTGVALIAALTVHDLPKRWHDAVRIVFYLPMLAAGIIIAQVWRWIFHIRGPINWLLGAEIAWFAQGATGIPAVTMIVAAVGIGGNMIVILAALLSIDRSLFDAARIDGASGFQTRWFIMVPIIWPTLLVLALLAAISAPQVFETIYALAPYEHTATVTFHIYREGFHMGRYGTAAAQAIVLCVLTLLMSWAKTKASHA